MIHARRCWERIQKLHDNGLGVRISGCFLSYSSNEFTFCFDTTFKYIHTLYIDIWFFLCLNYITAGGVELFLFAIRRSHYRHSLLNGKID